ncbi:MAG: universal stress protein [Actinomycetota bacterium]|nr:universal stress protein [Actinomycetota bacterium]
MEKIVVFGDDGSSGADLAWGWIAAQRWPGWRVDVLRADPPPLGPPVDPLEAEPVADEEPTDPRTPSAGSRIEEVRHLRMRSDPRIALLRSDAGLIVVGPRGRGLMKSLHLGSTAEYLLHHPPAPLLIARSERPVERVLVCVDGSPHADRALASLAGMPWAGSTRALILGVKGERPEIEEGIERAHVTLEGVMEEVSIRRTQGPVAQTILREATDLDADLIVMGTRGITGLRRIVVGSVASAVVRHAACSVLVAAAEE